LLSPHVRPLAHWLSASQSPPPKLHGLEVEQQLKSVVGLPSHEEGEGVGGGGAVGLVPQVKQNEPYVETTLVYQAVKSSLLQVVHLSTDDLPP